MKKGQLFGQPFVYIFIIVVAALILFFGFKAVRDILNLQEGVEFSTFVINLDEEIEKVYHLDYGSSFSLEDMAVSSNINEICFLDLDKPRDVGNIEDEIARELIDSAVNKNIFFISEDELLDPFFNEKIVVREENPLCVKVENGRINVRLTNQGTEVLVEKVI
jgi:hypothetical protein